MTIVSSTASNIFTSVLLNLATALSAPLLISQEFIEFQGGVVRELDFPFTEISFGFSILCAVISSYFFIQKKNNAGFLIAVVPLIMSSLILAVLLTPNVLGNAFISILLLGFDVPLINKKKWLFVLPGAITFVGSLVLTILGNH